MTKKSDPKPYTAPHDVYVSGQFHKAGDVFITDVDPEDSWNDMSVEDAKVLDGSQQKVPADPALDDMDVDALKALAAAKYNIDTTGLNSKKKLIDAVKAANEPKL